MHRQHFLPRLAFIVIFFFPVWAGANSPPISLMDAITQAFENHPSVQIAKAQVRLNRGAVQVATGGFDVNVQGSLGYTQSKTGGRGDFGEAGVHDDSNQVDQTSMAVSASKLLPWGMTVRTGAELASLSSARNIPDLEVSNSTSGPFLGSISFSFTQPLLRGFGAASTIALDATKQDLAAAREDLKRNIYVQVRQVVRDYWSYVAAQAFLDAALASQARAEELLRDNQRLVKADLRPAAELRQLEASFSDSKRVRIDAEQSVLESRFQLGTSMGLDVAASTKLGAPSTAMPMPPPPEAMKLEREYYLKIAKAQRRDLRAIQRRVKAAKIRLRGANNGLLPQLDLGGQLSYAGLGPSDEYFTNAVATGQASFPGYTAMVNLNLLWPPQNNIAEGQLAQAVASLRIVEESQRSLQQQIGASVASAVSGLSNRALIAHEGLYAAKIYEESVRNEEKKLKAGLSTLINLVLTRERLTSAQASAIVGLQRYANALLNLRFVTGRLFDSDSNQARLIPERILQFPKEAKP
jgi:outer membrane protein TolC